MAEGHTAWNDGDGWLCTCIIEQDHIAGLAILVRVVEDDG